MKSLYGLVGYLALVAYLSLYPWRFQTPAKPLNWGIPSQPGDLMDFAANIALYVPVGLLGGRLWWGVVFSAAIEGLQMFSPTRDANVRDLLCNTIGVALGMWGARRLNWSRGNGPAPLTLMVALAWVIWLAFPLIPVLRRSQLKVAVAGLLQPAMPSSWMEVGDVFCGVLVITLLLRRHPPLLMACLAVLPLQGLLLHRDFSWGRVVAGGCGLLMGWRFPPAPGPLAGVLCAWLLIRELMPFNFQGPPREFQWLPFEGSFSNPREAFYRTMAGKFLLYLSAAWALEQTGGTRWRAFGAVPVLLAGEVAQCYLPDRTPELTDPVMAAGAALLLPSKKDESGERRASSS